MDYKKKNYLVLFTILVLSAIIYVWYYPLNKGTINISVNQPNYTISVGNKNTNCQQKECVIKLKSGARRIAINKEGYYSAGQNIYIKRFESKDVQISIKKIPKLEISKNIPDNTELNSPDELKEEQFDASAWSNNKQMFVFLDKKDFKLKIWNEGSAIKPITVLKEVNGSLELLISSDNKYILATSGKDIYFIDIEKGGRQKRSYEVDLNNIVWLPKDNILLANGVENNLYKIDFNNKSISPLNTKINLEQTLLDRENKVIYLMYENKDKTTHIKSFDINTNETETLYSESNFQINKTGTDKDKNLYFQQKNTETWYILDY